MPGSDQPKRFSERTRAWRAAVILDAASELLDTVGCVEFKIDVLASTVGVAKGTVYRHVESRESLIGAVLERWMNDLGLGEPKRPADAFVGLTAVIEVLCHEVDRSGTGVQAAFPCCLRTSPCPCGWMSRWQTISEAYGLAVGDRTAMLGEAVQALAALPSSRALIEQGRLPELCDLLRDTVGDYLRAQ